MRLEDALETMASVSLRVVAFLLSLALPLACAAQRPDAPPLEPAKVMLLGVFHFDNPGLDAVKYRPIDVMAAAGQEYLVALSRRLARYAPTKVLLEYPEQRDATINARYAEYLAGRFELPRNEIYQLGFRVAKLAGHAKVYGIDVDAPPFDTKLWSHLSSDPVSQQKFMNVITAESQRLESAHRSLSLQQLLAMSNATEEDMRNKGFYLLLNDVAAQSRHFHGADMAANWWRRNFRMYALIQLHAMPGDRVLVIAGSGHTAVIRDIMRADGERLEQDVRSYLQATGGPN